MEGPAEFDVWCKIEQNARKAAAVWTANLHSMSIFDAYKLVSSSLKRDGFIEIFLRCGWDDIPRLRQELPIFVQPNSLTLTESTYLPSDCTRYCDDHSLRYVSAGCPVCEGNFISRVIDGKRIVSSLSGIRPGS